MLRVNAEGECREVIVEGACQEAHVCESESCCSFIESTSEVQHQHHYEES